MLHRSIKPVIIAVWLIALFSGILYLFWYHDVKYSLPTPVPPKYQAVATGSVVDLGERLDTSLRGKPVFIHFFNPSCPCSRFNIKHVSSLVRHYHDKIAFAVVVLGKPGSYSKEEIQQKFGSALPVSFDSTLAADCGVYSTPQAVLLDGAHRIYYRGNYNKSRYCSNMKTNYAQIALDSFLNNQVSKPAFSPYALKAYGCQLPLCSKR